MYRRLDGFLRGMGSLLVLSPTEVTLRSVRVKPIGEIWSEVGGFIREAMDEQAQEDWPKQQPRPHHPVRGAVAGRQIPSR